MTRRLQFSLRTLVKVTAVAAAFCGIHKFLPVAHGVFESAFVVAMLLFDAPPWFWE
jgi:hypothetical protein